MSLLRFFPPLKIVKEQQGSESSKEKGTPFFSNFFYFRPFFLFLPLNFFYFFLPSQRVFQKNYKKGSNFSIFSLFRNYSDSDTIKNHWIFTKMICLFGYWNSQNPVFMKRFRYSSPRGEKLRLTIVKNQHFEIVTTTCFLIQSYLDLHFP